MWSSSRGQVSASLLFVGSDYSNDGNGDYDLVAFTMYCTVVGRTHTVIQRFRRHLLIDTYRFHAHVAKHVIQVHTVISLPCISQALQVQLFSLSVLSFCCTDQEFLQ